MKNEEKLNYDIENKNLISDIQHGSNIIYLSYIFIIYINNYYYIILLKEIKKTDITKDLIKNFTREKLEINVLL